MDSITDLAPEIQKRISDFEYFLGKEDLKRPEVKFTGAILASMLKVHHVQLATLARGLGEEISLKKTCERLNRHLAKEEFGANLMKINLQKNSRKIKGVTLLRYRWKRYTEAGSEEDGGFRPSQSLGNRTPEEVYYGLNEKS